MFLFVCLLPFPFLRTLKFWTVPRIQKTLRCWMMDGWTEGGMESRRDRGREEWREERRNGWIEGRKEGWMDA